MHWIYITLKIKYKCDKKSDKIYNIFLDKKSDIFYYKNVMTENKYLQLKKRVDWLDTLISFCVGDDVSKSQLLDSIRAAQHFRADMVSKIYRFEHERRLYAEA